MLKCPQGPEMCYYKYIDRQGMKRVKKTGHDYRIAKAIKAILLLCSRR